MVDHEQQMDACQADETEVFQTDGGVLLQLSTIYRNGASAGVCQCEFAIGIELQMSLLSRHLLGIPFLRKVNIYLQSTQGCGASAMLANASSCHTMSKHACLAVYTARYCANSSYIALAVLLIVQVLVMCKKQTGAEWLWWNN